ncbi:MULTISPECIES: DUF5325 family protein [Fictibacillus]|uniref:DUF5325 family protein n=1 Tax=Fictibacillus terranigra TaxID=3058424 RepID=A0ABT8E6R0_9BACL|nr:DUF5325 family protein [Fictibacillus sp. CENA-BCM004]MDN4073590.1 DUF5325 family protein [Fictibacillus sp. CENA-BCM004]
MKFENIIFLIIAVLTTFSIALIGVAIGQHSWLIAITAIIAVFFLMGLGFSLKKRFRERNQA